MGQFKKKPVVIEAVQYVGGVECIKRMKEFCKSVHWSYDDTGMSIHTLEGTMNAKINDWIIKGIKGEFYPCKPDIFEQTYEAVATTTDKRQNVNRVSLSALLGCICEYYEKTL